MMSLVVGALVAPGLQVMPGGDWWGRTRLALPQATVGPRKQLVADFSLIVGVLL